MLLTEYRREHHIQCEKKLSFEEGCQVGRQEGLQEGHQEGRQEGICALVQSLREVGCTSAVIGEKLREKFALDETEIRRYLEEC